MDLRGTLREIEDQLPNGFHDAYLEAVTLDYVANTATMGVGLCVGDPDAATEEEREAYRKATLVLRGLVFFVIEPPYPDPQYEYSEGGGLWLRSGDDASDESGPTAARPLRPLPEGAFAHWFYVDDWNSFIHVAAREAGLQWREGPGAGGQGPGTAEQP